MKSMSLSVLTLLASMLIGVLSSAQEKTNQVFTNAKKEIKMDTITKKILIDKFFVPKEAKQEFDGRMKMNRNFIKTLHGFIEDNAYQRTDENGDYIVVTIAVWESEDAIKGAKAAVQAEYQREGFDMQGMLNRLGVTIDRGIYRETGM